MEQPTPRLVDERNPPVPLPPLKVSRVARFGTAEEFHFFYHWIEHFKLREGGEVAIRRPEFTHPVVKTERHDARVMDARAF